MPNTQLKLMACGKSGAEGWLKHAHPTWPQRTGDSKTVKHDRNVSVGGNPMRGYLLFPFASVALLCVAAGYARHSEARPSESATDSVREEIKKIEQERNQAILTGDAAALERMTSQDYTSSSNEASCARRPRLSTASSPAPSNTAHVTSPISWFESTATLLS